MSLYVPSHFRVTDETAALRVVREFPFATLLTAADADIHVTHLPLELDAGNVLCGHVASTNPHWRTFAGGRTIAIFRGPHAYISPTWYEQAPGNVPTWNYVVVHAHGTPIVVEERAELSGQMSRLVAHYEGEGPRAWRFDGDSSTMRALLRGIVAFRMPIERIEAKFKLSQNRSATDQARVTRALRESGRPEDLAVADLMSREGAR